jgi:ABC-type antimicrobial peptide transport system permease subunit
LRAQKINGIYKCIGYTTGHLILSNLCYVLAIALLSVAITLPISLLTYSSIMKFSLSMFNFSVYPMQLNLGHLFIANAAVLFIFAASTLGSSSALFKVNARDLVQE